MVRAVSSVDCPALLYESTTSMPLGLRKRDEYVLTVIEVLTEIEDVARKDQECVGVAKALEIPDRALP